MAKRTGERMMSEENDRFSTLDKLESLFRDADKSEFNFTKQDGKQYYFIFRNIEFFILKSEYHTGGTCYSLYVDEMHINIYCEEEVFIKATKFYTSLEQLLTDLDK